MLLDAVGGLLGGHEEQRRGAGERRAHLVARAVARRAPHLGAGQLGRTRRVAHDEPLRYAALREQPRDATADVAGRARDRDHRYAAWPVRAWPSTSAWISAVPS